MLILASASPRRRELLARLCRDFTVVPSGIEEDLENGATPVAVARLAEAKARAVALRFGEGVVLGADTVVVVDGEALGKPASAAEARRMLERLRGRLHEVITGIAVVEAGTPRAGAERRVASTAVLSRVLMARYSDTDIDAYVASGEPFNKAGAYAIQGRGGALVAAVVGSYSNVVGLPLGATARLLAGFGVPVSAWPGPA